MAPEAKEVEESPAASEGSEAAELKIARAIYRSLKRAPGALVQGAPDGTSRTLVDGQFNLIRVARAVLIELREETQQKRDR
jgi:hypothetical protein